MRTIKTICVFCGSSPGSDVQYAEAARELGRLMAARNVTLVYGGSNIGLMRAIADEVLQHGGKVAGVMPQGLIDLEVAYTTLEDFHVVDTMSQRKQLMAELSDAFIAMPGGIGTLDELFEVMSWNQLNIINKPVALLNTGGYYDHLVTFLRHTVDQRFVRPEHYANLLVDEDPEALLHKLDTYEPVKVEGKWW
jgi:uncharacterized protein (TIGR00730 family)